MKRASKKWEVKSKVVASATPHIVSPDDRADAGKALHKLAREEQVRWKPSVPAGGCGHKGGRCDAGSSS